MNHSFWVFLISGLFFFTFGGSACGAAKESSKADTVVKLPRGTEKKWTGDLDGMIKRRVIRVLVPYSKTYYFIDRGTQRGIAYEAVRLFEEDLNKALKKKNVRVHAFFMPVSRDKIIPYLKEGIGDIAVANLTITPQRLEVVAFSKPFVRDVSEVVITGPASRPVAGKEDLSGQEVYVRKSSSFYESLEQLNADLAMKGKAPVKIRLAPESLEVEDMMEMVNAGLVKATIVDSHIAEFWQKVFPKIVLNHGAAVRTGAETGWMFRQKSPQLKAAIDKFMDRYPVGSKTRNLLLQKYLTDAKYVKDAASQSERAKFEKVIDLFRKYGDRYEMDYLLMVAQGYQESRLDHNAKSRAGAIGIMQVMPDTGKELKVGDIRQMEPNINAGVKYIRRMIDQYYKDDPPDLLNKVLFAFASYNAGPSRIDQLRRIAAKRNLDPDVWFNNVELIAAEKIGRETVTYVSNIYKYYLAYQLIEEEKNERLKAIEQVKKEAR